MVDRIKEFLKSSEMSLFIGDNFIIYKSTSKNLLTKGLLESWNGPYGFNKNLFQCKVIELMYNFDVTEVGASKASPLYIVIDNHRLFLGRDK